jgi:hypothetical protein
MYAEDVLGRTGPGGSRGLRRWCCQTCGDGAGQDPGERAGPIASQGADYGDAPAEAQDNGGETRHHDRAQSPDEPLTAVPRDNGGPYPKTSATLAEHSAHLHALSTSRTGLLLRGHGSRSGAVIELRYPGGGYHLSTCFLRLSSPALVVNRISRSPGWSTVSGRGAIMCSPRMIVKICVLSSSLPMSAPRGFRR